MRERQPSTWGRFVLAWLLVIFGVHQGGVVWAQEAETFIQVRDADGSPVVDLSAEDFVIEQGGVACRVVRVELMNEPLRLALLVDDAEGANTYFRFLRDGLPAFADALPDTSQVALILTSGRPRVVVDHEEGLAKVKERLEEFFIDRSRAAGFFDGVRETVAGFDGQASRLVVAIVTTDGPSQSASYTPGKFDVLVNQLADRPITIHALGLFLQDGNGFQTSIVSHLTQITGGWYDTLNSPSQAVTAKLTEMATAISRQHEAGLNQYRVVYESPPEADPTAPISAGVRRAQVTLRVSADGRLAPVGGSGSSAVAGQTADGGGGPSREQFWNAGEVAFASGQIDEAAEQYEKAHQADPTWGKPLFKLAMVALNRGDIETAVKYFEQVVEVDPNSEEGAQATGLIPQLRP